MPLRGYFTETGSVAAMSLEHNSVPVAVPDFTRGDWNKTDGYRHAMLVQ